MNRTTLAGFGLAAVGVGILASVVLARPITADQPGPSGLMVPGRYQVALAGKNDTTVSLVVIDTATGRCWDYYRNGVWKDLGSPLQPRERPAGHGACGCESCGRSAPPAPETGHNMPEKPKSGVQIRETLRKTTQNVGNLSEELEKGAVLAETTIPAGNDPQTQSAAAYRTTVAKIAAMRIEYDIQIRNSRNNEEVPKPLSYDEFLTDILKKGDPQGIQLPMLPYYQGYAWDEENQKLVVVEYPRKKEEFEAAQPGPR
ncbi:MAG TPA: hypothetical protein VFT74_20355 [Isosphaeraceae bacterium]|nr:hypothetical protein [Isosphaeraceae bacterium]